MGYTYIVIDLKSFYASVECVERLLDPMSTNLVVADPERSNKTICLAVSPSMKQLGVKNRCRVFEIPQNIEYIMAPPRMSKYIEYAAEVYGIYLKYASPDDIYVYSIDEAFIDITHYLKAENMTAKEYAVRIMEDILDKTGLRATCGIGDNLYLAKIALDIMAKKSPDFIGILDEETFKKELLNHRPLSDFWRIGKSTQKRLNDKGIFDMRGILNADEDMLYRMFGIDAELLIDHAKGIEPVTMKDIKAYRPKAKCKSFGQVLMSDYSYEKAKTIVAEMADNACLELARENLKASSFSLYIGYSKGSVIKGARGTMRNFDFCLNSEKTVSGLVSLYENIADKNLYIRRIYITCNDVKKDEEMCQISFFDEKDEKENELQKTINDIKLKFGKNAMLKGMNLKEEATGRNRNLQIGGHKSGKEE